MFKNKFFKFFNFLMLLLNTNLTLTIQKKIEFVIVITSYNNEKFYKKNLDSAVNQKTIYPYSIIYINDCSKDKTKELVEEYIKSNNLESKITLINNEKNIGQLKNQFKAFNALEDHKIIVSLDGDDWLYNEDVLERLAFEYKYKDAWITYGQFIYYPQGNLGAPKILPDEVIKNNSMRNYPCAISHLKTFYAGLFKKIKKEDLKYEGKYISGAPDLAMMFPMLEMASKGHISFIPDILYVYNNENPLSEHSKNLSFQQFMDRYIRSKKPYDPLERLFS